ncbi:DUF2167 domain-containing protein [Pseudomonas sp. R-28-1W-6]|uniref:DUF2167 domain-containing protein n=1 Tax=Pseudomonas sp. R-28-1W-6 TaxID=2650101 RepID=UPI001366678E|nr:DUF2167 domain-containing protein [Pseudomonas sp. R-28-1W-6]MWV13030.1 DUF2167 domain-containing protein [Pseudomonas sp. R-28-1W-6]
MSIKELILAALLAAAVPAAHAVVVAPDAPAAAPEAAAPEEESAAVVEGEVEEFDEEAFIASLNFQTGQVVIGDNLATLNLPDNLVFLNGADAERLLVEAWGNPPDAELPLGMVLPAGISPLAAESWAATIEYEESGYVSDEDAADIDYADMLKDLQEESAADNQWRTENGYEPVELIGWASQPHYDDQGKKLHWAKELKFGDSESNTLNYNIRVLGRKGVLVLNFIANMDQLADIQQHVPTVLAMTDFNQGHRYAEFDPDMDEVAAYGIGALIAGKLAAKAGLFATLLILLKKLWIVPLLVIGWLGKRLFGKKQVEAPVASVEPVAEPAAVEAVQPPASTVLDLNKTDGDKP